MELCTCVREYQREVVYYESIKREIQTRPICECRCDERLKTEAEESTHLTYTELLGEHLDESCLLFIDKARAKDKR